MGPLAAALVMVGGCRACEEAPPPPLASTPRLPPGPTFTQVRAPTDDPTAALADAEREVGRLAPLPGDEAALQRAADGAVLVARVLGSPSALRALARAAPELALSTEPARLLLAARAYVAIGAFARASGALARATLAGADAPTLQIEIDLGLGEISRARTHAEALGAGPGAEIDRAERALWLGRALAAVGDTDAADRAFIDAERAFVGTSPFLLAEIYFARASLWERAGNLVEATSLYRAAVERIPRHTHAAVHLASLLSPADAIARLDPLAGPDASPDVVGALSVYRDLLKDGAGDVDRGDAARVYGELLGEGAPQPIAPIVANHAGWFYLRVLVDRERAAKAAAIDLAWHPTSEAFELALTASEGAPDRCELARRARALAHPSPSLEEQLRRVVDCP